MINDHPHKFFKPFNGIDAVGRCSILAALCAASHYSIAFMLKPSHIIRMSFAGRAGFLLAVFGIIIFFFCGLGLCLRKKIALRYTIICYTLFGTALVAAAVFQFIPGIEMTGGYAFYQLLTALIVAAVVLAAAVAYLLSRSVKAEFEEGGPTDVPEKPAWQLAAAMFIIGGWLFVAVIIWWERIWNVFGNISANSEINIYYAARYISYWAWLASMYGGILIAFSATLLFTYSRTGAVMTQVLAILYAVLAVVIFFGEGVHWAEPPNWKLFSISFGLISVPAAYVCWSVFRYARSRGRILSERR
ncbi:MAG: hypothetical protein ACYS8W_03765 [Planctomycetota bacterium]|jgi:hypothetical protein